MGLPPLTSQPSLIAEKRAGDRVIYDVREMVIAEPIGLNMQATLTEMIHRRITARARIGSEIGRLTPDDPPPDPDAGRGHGRWCVATGERVGYP